MKNNFGFKIVLPERKINVSTLKQMWKYMTTESIFQDNIIYSEESSKSLDTISIIAQFGPVVLPVKITERSHYLHFDTVVTNLPETPATVLQTHMWTKPVSTGLVYPFPLQQEDGSITFTVSGGIPKSKLQKSFIDDFLNEFVNTSMFVLSCYYELGPQGPNNKAQAPSWVSKLAKTEAEGPRSSEFNLDKKDEPPSPPEE